MSKLDRVDQWMNDDDAFSRIVAESAKRDVPPPGAKGQMLASLGLQAEPSTPGAKASASYAQKLGGYYLASIGVALVAAAASVVAVSYPTSAEPVQVQAPSASTEVGIAAVPTTQVIVDAPPVTTPDDLPTARDLVRRGAVQPKPTVVHSAQTATEALAAPPAAESLAAPAAPPAAESTLGRETLLVTGARSALAAGDTRGTLSLLDAYDKEFPSGAFVLEVSVLRIEALARSGRHDEARQLGDVFMAKHPRGALARRVAVTLGDVRSVER